MTSHQLAKKLLEGPDLPVTIYRGYHASGYEVADIEDFQLVPASPNKKGGIEEDEYYPTDHIHLSWKW